MTELWDIDVGLCDRVMAVDVRGQFLIVKHVAPAMIKAGYGKIVNMASGTAYRGIPHMAHYVTSNGAMLGFTRALARDLGPRGIRVNTLAPGLIMSDSILVNTKHIDEMRDAVIAARSFFCRTPGAISWLGKSWLFAAGRRRYEAAKGRIIRHWRSTAQKEKCAEAGPRRIFQFRG